MLRDAARAALVCCALLLAGSPGGAGAQPSAPAPCAAPPSGMRAWFTADGTAQDRAGANHGALLNGATFAPGRVGQAFSFDGVDDRFEVPDHPSLTPAQVTVEGWVRLDALDSPGDGLRELNIVTRRNPASSSGYELIKTVDDAFAFRITSGAGQTFAATSTTHVVTGRFYHLAGTYDGQAVRLYVDGGLETEMPIGSVTIDYGVQPLVLGASGDPLNPRAMMGLLDEVTIYGRALTDEEVGAIHAAQASGKCRDRDLVPVTLPDGEVGVPYSQRVSVSPASGPQTFRIVGGNPPSGLGVSVSGLLGGTPAAAGAFDFTVEARDTTGAAVSRAYELDVFQCPVRPPGLVAWYGGEGTATDQAGTNHGTLRNGAAFAPGLMGQAFSLDGLDDHVEIPDAPALDPTGQLTLAAWVFPTADSGAPDVVGIILNKERFTGITQYEIGRRNATACFSGPDFPAGNFAFFLGGLSGLPNDCSAWVDGNGALPLGQWSHVALTFDGALVRTYVNGVLTRELVTTGTMPVDDGALRIGGRDHPTFAHWGGLIDEVMIFGRALGQGEITSIIDAAGETCAGPPNHAPRLTVPGRQTNAVLDTVRLPLVARDPDLDTLTWRATGLPPGLVIDPATGVIAGALRASAGGEHTVVAFVSDGLAETRGSFGWTVLGSNAVSIGDTSVNRSATGTTPAVFAVTLSPALTAGSAGVQFAIADGTARAGVDYVASSGILSFPPGQRALTISVTVLAGTGAGPDRTFFVDLSSPAGAQLGRARGVGTIVGGQTSVPVTITLVETIGVSDPVTVVPPRVVIIAEAVGVADSPGLLPPASIPVSEMVGVTDVSAVVPPMVVAIAEAVGVTDGPGAVPPRVVAIAEAVGVADGPGVLSPAIIPVSEMVGVTDVSAVVPPMVVAIAEAVGVADGPGAVPPQVVAIAEAVGVADGPGVLPPASIPVSEMIGVTDVSAVVPPMVVAIAEAVGVADGPGAVPPQVVAIAEAVGVADGPGAVPPRVVAIAEAVGVADGPGAVPPQIVAIAEAVGVADGPGALPPAVISIAEAVGVTDASGAGPPNRMPIADAGPDLTVATSATVTLDGSGSSDPDGPTPPLRFAWTLLTRPAGSNATLSSATSVNPTFVADRNGDYVVQLIVSDGALSSAGDTVTIAVRDGADLRVEFFDFRTTPAIGSGVPFGIQIRNGGPADATGVTARFLVPPGYTQTGVFVNPGSYDATTGNWTIGPLSTSEAATLILTANVNATGPYDLTVAITGSSQPDPNPANNTVTIPVTPDTNADLRVEFFDFRTTPAIGSSVPFGIQIRNGGPSDATGVTARFLVPPGYTQTGVFVNPGSYDATTGNWTIGPLPTFVAATLILTADVNATGPYDLTAAVTGSSQPDPNSANNTLTIPVTPNPNADLRIAFVNPPATPAVGSVVSLDLHVINDGPASTTGVTASFQVPAGYTVLNGGSATGSYDATTGVWMIGVMASGSGVGTSLANLSVSARVNASGPYDLTAAITGSSQPDPNPANNSVTVSVRGGAGIITTIAGTTFGFSGDGGPALAAQLSNPLGIAVAPDGTIFFADASNFRIRRISPAGIISTVAGNGTGGDSGDGGAATDAQFLGVESVALDPVANVLYFADLDNNRVRKVDLATGIITNFAGFDRFGGFGLGGDGGPATAAKLAFPIGVAVDTAGNVYIADSENCRIRKVDAGTGIIDTIAGTGDIFTVCVSGGDGGPATAASFSLPFFVAVDRAGNVFVLDVEVRRVRRIDAVTGIITTVAGGGSVTPGVGTATTMELGNVQALTTDDAGHLFIGTFTQIYTVDPASDVLSVFAGTGVAGFGGDGGPALAASFSDIFGLAVAPTGELLVSDAGNSRVRSIAPDAPVIPSTSPASLATSQAFLGAIQSGPPTIGVVEPADVSDPRGGAPAPAAETPRRTP